MARWSWPEIAGISRAIAVCSAILDDCQRQVHNIKQWGLGFPVWRKTAATRAGVLMAEFLGSPFVSVVVLVAVTAMAIAGGAYLIGRVRAGISRKEPPASEWLTNFKELHGKGELSDEEYRTIKAMLAERLQRELNSTDEPR